MEETKELTALLERIDQTNRSQLRWARLQCIFSIAAAVCCAGALILVLSLLPKINSIAQQADTLMQDMQQISSQLAQADWEGMMSDLQQVSQQLVQADLEGIAQDVGALVQSTQTGVEEALGKLDSIDLDTLNQAIEDLSDVVEPLARFANRF